MARKCPLCGRSEEDLFFVEGICIDCFLKRRLTPEYRYRIPYCPYCGRVKLHGRWIEGSEDIIKKYILDKAEAKLSKTLSKYGVTAYLELENEHIKAILYKDGKTYVARIPMIIDYAAEICEECKRKTTGYHDATIQFRGREGKLTRKQVDEIMKKISQLPDELRKNIVKMKKVKGGIDAEIYGQVAAKIIANRVTEGMISEMKTSYKTVSVKNGKRKTRMTVSVRLYDYSGSSIVAYRGEPAVILGRDKGELKLLIIPDRKVVRLSAREAETQIRTYRETTVDAQVTAVAPDRVYALRLDNYDTEIIEPENVVGAIETGATGKIIAYKGKVYLVIL